jgi:hypothetical protein
MDSTEAIFQKNVVDIKLKNEQLRADLQLAMYTLNSHCDEVKNRIDLQTETLIMQINSYRQELFDEIDAYEREAIAKFKQSLDEFKQEFDSFSFDINNFDSSKLVNENSQSLLDLSKQYTKRLNEQEIELNAIKFNDKLIGFERNLYKFDSRLLGSIYYRPVRPPKVFEELDNEGRVKYKSVDLSHLLKHFKIRNENVVHEGVKQLASKKYIHYSFQGNSGIHLVVLPNELNSINSSIRIAAPSFSEFHVATSLDRIVLFYYLNSSLRYLTTFNDNLEVLHEFKFDEDAKFVMEKLTANQELIICLTRGGNFNHSLRVFDWSLKELTDTCRAITDKIPLYKHVIQFEADEHNHLFVKYEDIEENVFLNTVSLTSGERLNRFVGYPYKDFVPYSEQLVVSYRMQSLFYIDSVDFLVKRKRDGIRLTSKRMPDNDRYDIKMTKLIRADEASALFYGKDKILHFVFFHDHV